LSTRTRIGEGGREGMREGASVHGRKIKKNTNREESSEIIEKTDLRKNQAYIS
jgi:hypothetical protein